MFINSFYSKIRQLFFSICYPVSMIPFIAFGFILFLIWAYLSEIDQGVRASGQLISTARTQVIQASDGGVLSQLLVQEGDRVAAGQVLALLEPERAQSGYEESVSRVMSLKAALVRLQAELSGAPLIFGPEFSEYLEFVTVQNGHFQQRKQALHEEISLINDAILIAKKELDTNVLLFSNGDVGEMEVLRAQRQLLDLQGREKTSINKYLQEASAEKVKVQDELSSQTNKLTERRSFLQHTKLIAPIAGVVKLLKITTIGGVLRVGDELMQISPDNEETLIEIKVNPSDVGQLAVGLPVSIKMDAFDYSIYGTLQGKLAYISSDTLMEQSSNGQSITYYRARVVLASDQLHNSKLNEMNLKLGMGATVDIRTGQRSILNYLLKPIVKSFNGALSEK